MLAIILCLHFMLATSQETSPSWPPKIGIYDQKISHYDFPSHSPTFRQRFVYEGKLIYLKYDQMYR